VAKRSYLKVIILSIFIAGCEEYKYTIEMKPCDEGVQRKLTCPHNLPEDKRKSIAKLYQKQTDPNTFWGRFNQNLPRDVGGAGFYTTVSTDMGRATIYSERFRGDDNLNDTLEQAQLIADRSIEFLIGWLEYELGDDPSFVNLKAFCNQNLRHDGKNMMIYLWLSNVLPEYKSGTEDEIQMRMEHYVIERGYLSPKEMHVLIEGSEADEEDALRLLRRFVADKMGYSSSGTAVRRLVFLSDGKHAEESAMRYIRMTDLFKELWEEKKLAKNDPNVEPPEIGIGDFITHGIDAKFDLFSWSDSRVEVILACENKPFETNGEWNEQANQVAWSSRIAGDEMLPTFFYASWSEPNRKFQEEHFGRVVLIDEALAQYCMWRENVDGENGKQWDAFILSLKPSEDLKEQVSSFRFSRESQEQKESEAEQKDLAEKPRQLILAGLEAEKGKKEQRKVQPNETRSDKVKCGEAGNVSSGTQ
jgi:hypothetical protein